MEIKTGIIGPEGIRKNILHELLSQQGVLFEDVDKYQVKKYPCVIILDGGKNVESITYARCVDTKNIIHIDKVIPIEKLMLAFTGHFEEPYRMNNLLQPVISGYGLKILNLIRACYLRANTPFIHKWYWPNFANACLIVTHDIDNLIPSNNNSLFSFIKNYILRKINMKHSNVVDIANIEFKSGIKSSFYFFSEYKKQQEFENVLAELKMKGFEIGLHGSLFSFQNENLLKLEMEKLSYTSKIEVRGERQHGLNFLNPHTWRYLDKLDFEYDTSFYYNDKIGFRCGICHPYHPFDILTDEKFNLIEIPTCFMDFSAICNEFTENDIESVMDELENAVCLNNGCFVVNFHNEYFGNKRYAHIDNIFKSILQKGSGGAYWIATAEECARWWKKREFTDVYSIDVNGKSVVVVDRDLFIKVYYPDGTQKEYSDVVEILI